MSPCQDKRVLKLLWSLLAFLPSLRAEDTTTIIDDSDPDITALSGQWIHFTGDEYYNKTETLTRDAGATSMYIFNGTGISVFGTQCDPAGGNTTVSTYMVDNGGRSTYTVPSGVVCNQNFVNFFTSPPLDNGKHTLVITNLNENAWYFLDYLQVVSPGSSSTSNTTTPSTASSSTASSSSASSSASQATSTNGSSQKSMNTGVIVGSALGAAAVVAIVILAFMVYWRRRKQASQTHKESTLSEIDEDPGRGRPIPYPTSTFVHSNGGLHPPRGKLFVMNTVTTTGDHSSSSNSAPQSSTTNEVQTDTTVTSPSMVSVNRQPTISTMPPPYGEHAVSQ